MSNVTLPQTSVAVVDDTGRMTRPWYQLLTGLANQTNATTKAAAASVDLASGVTGVLPVANGGTGDASLTAYAPLFGGTTTTGPVQSGTVGTAGQVLMSNGAGTLPTMQTMATVDCICGLIETPQAKDYVVCINVPFAFTANTMSAKTSVGTCTLVTKKNTTAVTGLSNSVSSAQSVTTATAGNSFAVGDDVRLTLSSLGSGASTPQNLSFCLKITRDV